MKNNNYHVKYFYLIMITDVSLYLTCIITSYKHILYRRCVSVCYIMQSLSQSSEQFIVEKKISDHKHLFYKIYCRET